MTMKGVDVSNWQGWPFGEFVKARFDESDFCIVKATEGVGFTNPKMEKAARKTVNSGKRLGFYHYSDGGDPKKEAAYFYSVVHAYVGQAAFAIDWEGNGNAKFGQKSAYDWCVEFLDAFCEISGAPADCCYVYVSVSALAQVKSCYPKYRLWAAGYPDNRNSWNVPKFNYSVAPWKAYTIWQYTSSGGKLDRNTCKLTAAEWDESVKIAADESEEFACTMTANTYVRTGRSIKYKKVRLVKKGESITIDRTVRAKNGKLYGHLKGEKYAWIRLEDKTKAYYKR